MQCTFVDIFSIVSNVSLDMERITIWNTCICYFLLFKITNLKTCIWMTPTNQGLLDLMDAFSCYAYILVFAFNLKDNIMPLHEFTSFASVMIIPDEDSPQRWCWRRRRRWGPGSGSSVPALPAASMCTQSSC